MGRTRAKQDRIANIYMANEIERRYDARGLHALSLMPGEFSTGLEVHIPDNIRKQWSESVAVANYRNSPEQGASTTIYTVLSRDREGRGGNVWKTGIWLRRPPTPFNLRLAMRHMH